MIAQRTVLNKGLFPFTMKVIGIDYISSPVQPVVYFAESLSDFNICDTTYPYDSRFINLNDIDDYAKGPDGNVLLDSDGNPIEKI